MHKLRTWWLGLSAALLLALTLASPAIAQRGRGSFGGFGGGRSFGGGGFGSRSFGGGGFGGRSYGGGSFGGGSRSFSPGGSSSVRSGSSSFNRTGAFGSSGRVNSTSIRNAPAAYRGMSPTSTIIYGGHPGYYYGGYGDYWFHPAWYYWLPFHPAFYYSAPYYDPMSGAYYPGGFSFTRLLFGIIIIVFVIWLLAKIFGGGKGVRYTNYR